MHATGYRDRRQHRQCRLQAAKVAGHKSRLPPRAKPACRYISVPDGEDRFNLVLPNKNEAPLAEEPAWIAGRCLQELDAQAAGARW